mgnify:CR=1 FL=1
MRNFVQCDFPMAWKDRSDGFRRECRKVVNGKKHRVEASIKEGSWFDNAKLTIEKAVKFTYWWTRGLKQYQIKE